MPKGTFAKEFLKCFVESYVKARKQFDDERWRQVWSSFDTWNRLILWRTAKPPEGLEKSVLHRTAEMMGLEYWEGEPLKLDGAFYSPDTKLRANFPFPMLVALEHESFSAGFSHEVMKLLSVRAPLKVGITYAWPESRAGGAAQQIEQVRRTVVECFEEIQRAVGEDSAAEYLFLMGSEESTRELTWYALAFNAGQTPAALQFTRA